MLKRIGDHIGGNLWLWTGIGFAVAIAAGLARFRFGKDYYLGEIMTLAAMFGSCTLILISQIGLVHAPVPDDDD
jgi:hypothetical protein